MSPANSHSLLSARVFVMDASISLKLAIKQITTHTKKEVESKQVHVRCGTSALKTLLHLINDPYVYNLPLESPPDVVDLY